jgi:hypothetical protein
VIKIVYFDRNVINSIKKELIVGDANYRLLRTSVREGRLLIPISGPLLEETLPILNTSSTWKRNMEQQILSELFNWDWLVIFHAELLESDIVNYAEGRRQSFPFRSLNLTPDEFFNPAGHARKVFIDVINETEKLKQKQFLDVKQARAIYQQKFPSFKGDFRRFWDQAYEVTLEHIVTKSAVLQKCKERGLDGLLKIKSVRLFVTWYVGYFYFSFVRNERIKPSDSRDHHHAVSASVADIFVTHDTRFARTLKLVPIEGFEIIDLKTLLRRLHHPTLFGFESHDYREIR